MTDRDEITQLPTGEAEQAIESLRKGIPPGGMVRSFTVGRQTELNELAATLARPSEHRGSALLIRANYGAGKSHLLRVIREMALGNGYAVASVTVDSQSGVRFNRMDTILGAICRTIEVPASSRKGVGVLFEHYFGADESRLAPSLIQTRREISDDSRWGLSERLSSPAMFVALRAWATSSAGSRTRDVAVDWLTSPDKYYTTPGRLYDELVGFRGHPFREPRSRQHMLSDGVFESYDGIIRNNVIIDTDDACIATASSYNVKIYNNSCYNVAKRVHGAIFVSNESMLETPGENVEIKNNIVVIGSARPAVKIGPGAMADISTLRIDRNMYSRMDGGAVTFLSEGHALFNVDIAAWTQRLQLDGTSMLANPNYASVETLLLRDDSPAINAGIATDVVTDDFRHAQRPRGDVFDIGAYEMR